MTITTNKQIFGFNELLHYENEMSLFNVECIEESEAFFISKESFFYLADKNTALKTRCAKLVEEKAKFYIFLIQRYMENFNKDIKHSKPIILVVLFFFIKLSVVKLSKISLRIFFPLSRLTKFDKYSFCTSTKFK